MQELPNLVAAFAHFLEPLLRDGSQYTSVLFHPHINGGITLAGSVESQQIRSHGRSSSWQAGRFQHNLRRLRGTDSLTVAVP
jgi:hypothetical protein